MSEQLTEQAPARTWTDSPASLTVKFLLGGFDSMLTLRAETGTELLRKLAVMLQALNEMGAQPTTGYRSQPATANGNGNGNGNGHQAEEQPPLCAIHGTLMVKRQNGKTGAAFWSCGTKLADGSWCPYRPSKK